MRPAFAFLFLCITLSACAKERGPLVWQQGSLRVLVHETRVMDEHFAEVQVEVSDGKRRYCFESGALGGAAERRASFEDVGFHDGLLFVPASCGGGNASKCQGFEAFATRPALKWIGNVTGRWDGKTVVVYEDGSVYDTGDQLESNALCNHAESPRYTVVYKAGAPLSFLASATWDRNQAAYAQADDHAPGLLFRAGLAKLCGRALELAQVTRSAAERLTPAGYKAFQKSLLQVQFGKSQPRPLISVFACPA